MRPVDAQERAIGWVARRGPTVVGHRVRAAAGQPMTTDTDGDEICAAVLLICERLADKLDTGVSP